MYLSTTFKSMLIQKHLFSFINQYLYDTTVQVNYRMECWKYYIKALKDFTGIKDITVFN